MRTTPLALTAFLFLSLAAVAPTQAQDPTPEFEFYPGARYDAAIPPMNRVNGYEMGERISSHAETERYMRALADASPRVRMVRYGESWEGRALYYLVIASEQNMARLDEIKKGMQVLADPRGVPEQPIEALLSTLPSISWLAYSVHGNEISCTDAALHTAYHLAAAVGDDLADAALANSVVIIDPLQNPDGRDRFVHHYRQTRGRWPDADSQSAEHNEAWPGGRTNHYLFDMNRDWIALTQPETRARVASFLEWYPQVYVDLHEMGSNSTYYFAPPAEPTNPEFTAGQMRWTEVFGKNNARWFDRMGFDYFVREVFDAFYPGYGEGWPMLHGAIGMTYEQASVRGLVVKRDDETSMHYRDSVRQHFIASLATVETAALSRATLLRSFADYRREACQPRAADPKAKRPDALEFLFPPGQDPGRTRDLVRLLMAQGIEVKESGAAFRHERVRGFDSDEIQQREMPAGTYLVSLAQPASHLARTLLSKQQSMADEYIAEQKRRRKKRLSTTMYDVTAWSLPFLFDVECFAALDASRGSFRVLTEPPSAAGRPPASRAKVAYLVRWGTNSAARALAAMLRGDLRVFSTDKEFRMGDDRYPRGSLIVKAKNNPPDLFERLARIATETGAEITATDSSWVDEGVGFGSNQVHYLERPRIALAYDRPTSAYSAGWARFLLEQTYGYPVTIVRARQLGSAELDRYNVLIVPNGRGYGAVLGSGVDRLKSWIRAGGTLVTLGEATRWLTEERVALLATEREKRKRPGDDKSDKPDKPDDKDPAKSDKPDKPGAQKGAKKPSPEPFDLEKAIQPDSEYPDRTPGAIVRISIDPEHWLGFGYDGDAAVLVNTRNIFTPVKLDKGRNVAVYAAADDLLLSGFTWEEVRDQLAQKAFLVHQPLGRGHVVAFAEDPNFRGLSPGLNRLFLNAVLLGPGH